MSSSAEADAPVAAPDAPGESAEDRDGSKQSEQPQAENFEDPEGGFEWAEGRGHNGAVVFDAVKTRTMMVNPTFHVAGNYVAAGGGDTDRGMTLAIADVTCSAESHEPRFVEPGSFGRLVECVQDDKVVLLTGVGCGRRTAAEAALVRTGHRPVLQLPADVTAGSLVDVVEHECAKRPKAGFVVESMDSETLAALAGFDLRRLKSALPAGACVVLTAGSRRDLPSLAIDAPVVECTAPDLRRVIEKAGAGEKAVPAALEALDLLEGQVGSPEAALALLKAADDSSLSPAEIAEVFAGRATEETLNGWLVAGQAAEHVASLVAGAALDGSPARDVDEAAAGLAKLFAGEAEEAAAGESHSAPMTFKPADRGWPTGVLSVVRRPLSTHFGSHETEVVEVSGPHTPERILSHLWRCLGPEFRGPLLRWLRDLPASGGGQVSFGAAVAAGILFAQDPPAIEADLLKPWALDGRVRCRACAGLALGVPAATGADPAAARALARTWGNSRNMRLRHVAVLAYGGLLGAWDSASAAPSHLWRIAEETPALQRSADVSLASLTAAGGSAGRARAAVLAVLCAQAPLRRSQERAFGLLPLIVRHLTSREAVARESLSALLGEPERNSLAALAELLAQALLVPQGYESACAALRGLLEAMAESRVEEEAVCLLIGHMLAATPEAARADSLEAQLRRPLLAHARGRGPLAEAAQTVVNRLFSTS